MRDDLSAVTRQTIASAARLLSALVVLAVSILVFAAAEFMVGLIIEKESQFYSLLEVSLELGIVGSAVVNAVMSSLVLVIDAASSCKSLLATAFSRDS